MERRQQLLMRDIKTASLEALVPSELKQHLATNRARLTMYGRFDAKKSKPTLKPAEVNSHSGQLRQKAPQIRWRWTTLAKEARKARKGKVMARAARKKVNIRIRARIQARRLSVWYCREKGHLSTECWSNHKIQSGSSAAQNNGGKGKPKTSQAREQARRNRETSCSGGTTTAASCSSSLDLASIETLVT